VAGKYEVLDLIGRGGMGSVWQGRHTTLGTHVAIKFVDAEHAQSHEARSRFVTEARAAASIQSKHAIQIFDHGVTDDGRPFIVMELLSGEPLDRRLERVGRLSLVDTAKILGQVCRAVQRAHDAGIVHRDLKPENIFLVRSPDDDEEIAKVLDFGIAKIMAAPGVQGATSSTKTGAVLGTPYYMSPEQARGLRNIDHRTDLWSLGVIAYRCTTGVLPFEGESVGDLLVNICTATVPAPSASNVMLSREFDAWFFRAMEREPQRRFARASELSSSLSLAAGLSAGGTSASRDEAQLAPPVARVATGAMPAAGISAAAFTRSAPAPHRPRRAIFIGSAAVVGAILGVVGVVKLIVPPRASSGAEADSAPAIAPTRDPPPPVSAAAVAAPSVSLALPTPAASASANDVVRAPAGAKAAPKVGHGVPPPGTSPPALTPPAKAAPARISPPGADPGY
jgi:serine/threonine-protein kinase